MAVPSDEPAPAAAWLRRGASLAVIAPIAALLLYTAWIAVSAAFANDDFPETLAVKVELLPIVFPVHMVTGGLALILLPLAIALRRRPRWHRPVGRIAAGLVAVAGLTAYPVAWAAPVTFWSALGFSAQASVWLVLLARGIVHVRARRIVAHRRCMALMTATAMGAVFFRLYLAAWAAWGSGRGFEAFYALDAWIAWLLPLGATALWLKRGSRSARITLAM